MKQEPDPRGAPAEPRQRSPMIVLLTSHWLSRVGLVLVLTALCTWIFMLPAQLRSEADNPYLGVLTLMIVPIVLVTGLVLVPLGAWLARRQVERRLAILVDKRTAWSRFLVTFGAATLVNLAVGTQVTYRAIHHMETPQFCGSCHVMTPEARAHADSPHAQVACAECHVGDGAGGLISSKLAGARQFVENLTDSFHRPIPSGLATDRLIPAKQTCEECHWRAKPGNLRVRVIDSFAADEANSLSQTVLTMHVGGRVLGGTHGRHLDPNLEFRFACADAARQDIVWAEVRDKRTGQTRTFTKSGATPEQIAGARVLEMECIDCHNRPAHAFQLPSRAIDAALSSGRLTTSLPFLKKFGLELLQAGYVSQDEAAQRIPAGLAERYRSEHAELAVQRASEIQEAGHVLAEIHNRNVYPDLKVGWGTYPDNIGHTDSPGCFRCHGGDHKTAEGRVLTNNCATCHFTSALDETAPEILQSLGLEKVLERVRKK